MNMMMQLAHSVLFIIFFMFANISYALDRSGNVTDQYAEAEKSPQGISSEKCNEVLADGEVSGISSKQTAVCPNRSPILRIEAGMHTARIQGISSNKECTMLATASADKTVRIWNMNDGILKRIFRFPIEGNIGGVLSVAVFSKDGKWLVVGGQSASWQTSRLNSLYVINIRTGDMHRIGSFDENILSIALSSDGAKVAVGLNGRSGIRVLDFADGRELMADHEYGWGVFGVTFSDDGYIYTSSADGFIRKYDANLKLSEKLKIPKNGKPGRIALRSEVGYLAVGFMNSNTIALIDINKMKVIREISANDLSGDGADFGSVAWDLSGHLVAGGRAWVRVNGEQYTLARTYDQRGARVGEDILLARDLLTDFSPCGDNISYASAEPAFGVFSKSGGLIFEAEPVTADMRNKTGQGFMSSSDGSLIRFGLKRFENAPVLFDLNSGSLFDAPSPDEGLHVPDITSIKVNNWFLSRDLNFNGIKVDLLRGETSLSLANRGDKSGFVVGTSFRILRITNEGEYNIGTPSAVWGVNIAQNGNVIVAALTDGTIRWYRWSDGKELLALFVHAKDRRWVAWTPTGYYMASPGGEDLIGWHVNRGWDQEPDFFPASRFRDKFSRPDIVKKVLITLDEDKAVAEANAEAGRKQDTRPIEAMLPPVVSITAPHGGDRFSAGEVTLDYTIRSPSGLKVDGIDVLIDGRPASGMRGIGRTDMAPEVASCLEAASRGVGRSDEKVCHLTVPVPGRDVEVGLIARSGNLASTPSLVRLTYVGAAPTASQKKPGLHVLAIGVSDYTDPDLRLGLAGKDALDFAKAVESQNGRLYGSVEVRRLVDRDATRVAVLDGLEWLERQMKDGDTAMVFMAGHGLADEKGTFWFLPSDASAKSVRATAISQDDLRRTLAVLRGRTILFLDACHAGRAASTVVAKNQSAVDINLLVNDLSAAENGIVTFASSTGRELSQENSAWGNGAFTRALLDGLAGQADLLKKGQVTLTGLEYFVANRVKDLTGDGQHPVMTKPPTIPDYPIVTLQ